MEISVWISILGLGATLLSTVIAAAILYGKLQQRVTQLERDVAGLGAWKDSSSLQIAQVAQLPEDIRAIKISLADMRVWMSRFEGYQEGQRERERERERDRIQRRDTIPP